MADFRVDVGFFGHIKTKKLRKRLGLEGVFALQVLWAYAAQHEHDGAKVYTAEDISIAVDWQDESIAESLADIGFLDRVEGGYILHEWEVHNGYAASASKRTEAARIAANKRWEGRSMKTRNAKACEPQCDSNANACDVQCDSNAPSPSPSPSPSPKESGGEKRFSPPSLEEVTSYCLERGNNVDPVRWHSFYAGKGWMVGKNKMVDWKQAVITWESRNKDSPGPGKIVQPRSVKDALTIQGEEIARVLNEDRRRQQARLDDREAGGVLLEHPV